MGKARGGERLPARPHLGTGDGADNSNGKPSSNTGTATASNEGRELVSKGARVLPGAALQARSDRAILQEAVRDLRSADPRVKVSAIRALGQIRHRMVVPTLVQAFDDPSDSVRSECLNALTEVGEASTASLYRTALSHDKTVRVRLAAIRGLYRLGRRESAPAIARALEDGQPAVRRRAALCLAWLGAEEDASSLLPLFRDGVPEVRAAAVEAVGTLRYRSAIPGLIHALEDQDPRVCERANHSLKRITGKSFGTAPATGGKAFQKIAKKWQGWWSVS